MYGNEMTEDPSFLIRNFVFEFLEMKKVMLGASLLQMDHAMYKLKFNRALIQKNDIDRKKPYIVNST